MLIDSASSDLLLFVAEKTKIEKARRLPLHNFHRWWSRRFSIIYRFLLSSYLFKEELQVKEALERPYIMRNYAKGKIFMEPFAGGGTGLAEAAMAGWSVYGIDVNPVAAAISKASTYIVAEGLPKNYYNLAVRVLDEALNESKEFWYFNEKLVSYVFISRGKAPTWISTKSVHNKKTFIALCPRCLSLNQSFTLTTTCRECGEEFEINMNASIQLPKSLPETALHWKVFALELRDPQEKWKKEYISTKRDKKVRNWLKGRDRKLQKLTNDVVSSLASKINVTEAVRLIREAGIEELHQLFTRAQLYAFKIFSLASKKLAKTRKERLFLGLALSESTKASSLAAKWHPPIGEPVPAAAMKTYWIPHYTVEANPLAHVPGTLRPLGRNTIASALRAQLKAHEYVQENGGIVNTSVKIKIRNSDAEKVRMPKKVQMIVVDPPYMDSVKSYASLSLIHYSGLKIFDSFCGTKFVSNRNLKDIELREIPRDKEGYEKKLCSIFTKLSKSLDRNSRMVLMYNRIKVDDWTVPLQAAKLAGLYPTAIYWVPGEAPGTLARSRLRGIYLIIMKKLNRISNTKTMRKPHIVFEDVISELDETFPIDREAEYTSLSSLLQAFNSIYYS